MAGGLVSWWAGFAGVRGLPNWVGGRVDAWVGKAREKDPFAALLEIIAYVACVTQQTGGSKCNNLGAALKTVDVKKQPTNNAGLGTQAN